MYLIYFFEFLGMPRRYIPFVNSGTKNAFRQLAILEKVNIIKHEKAQKQHLQCVLISQPCLCGVRCDEAFFRNSVIMKIGIGNCMALLFRNIKQ